MRLALLSLACLIPLAARATPVSDFQGAVDYAMQDLASPYTISGFVSQTGMTDTNDFEAIAKPAGSLTGTASLATLAGQLGLTDQATMTGTATGSDSIKWILSAPTAIGKTVNVTVNGSTVAVKITGITGELNGRLTNIVPIPDPKSGVGRNVRIEPIAAGPNFVQVKGTVSIFFPVTYRIDPAAYIGYGGSGTVVSTVSGTVSLGSIGADSPAGKTLTLQFFDAGSNLVRTENTPLNASGGYSVTVPLYGDYSVVARVSHWLSAVHVNKSVRTAATLNYAMLNGNCNGDDEIDFFDYLAISASYDSNVGDPQYSASADLNEDGTVDLFDYLILSSNYEQSGPIPQ
ncbi:MAG: hypothetical protein JNM85_09630 [Chthonomonas sp.]|nr:hypothetical protein [Chthonomonas sp.]